MYWVCITPLVVFNSKICGMLFSEAKKCESIRKVCANATAIIIANAKKPLKFMRNSQRAIGRLASIESIDVYDVRPSV